eukprot:scaffold45640_cov15-Tisochrysis_lutea.AAC.1
MAEGVILMAHYLDGWTFGVDNYLGGSRLAALLKGIELPGHMSTQLRGCRLAVELQEFTVLTSCIFKKKEG